MRLNNLIDDREPEAGAPFKVRLERLEDFFRLLWIDAFTCIGETDFPVSTAFGERYGQLSTFFFHRPYRILAKIPEHLLKLVAVGQHPRFRFREGALKFDSGALGDEPVLKQGESVFK